MWYSYSKSARVDISYKEFAVDIYPTGYDDDNDNDNDGCAEGICSKCGDKQAQFTIPKFRLKSESLLSDCCDAAMVDDDEWYWRGEDAAITFDGKPYCSYSAWPRKEMGD